MIQCLEFLLEVFLVRIPVRDLFHFQRHHYLQGVQEYKILMPCPDHAITIGNEYADDADG